MCIFIAGGVCIGNRVTHATHFRVQRTGRALLRRFENDRTCCRRWVIPTGRHLPGAVKDGKGPIFHGPDGRDAGKLPE